MCECVGMELLFQNSAQEDELPRADLSTSASNHPPCTPFLPVSNSHTHLAAARFSDSLFFLPEKASALSKNHRRPGRRHPRPHAKGIARRYSIGEQGNAIGQLELCHGTTAKLSKAAAPATDIFKLGFTIHLPATLGLCLHPKSGSRQKSWCLKFYRLCQACVFS